MRFRDCLLPLGCLVLAAACSSKSAPPPSADAWAVVNGREIRRDDVEKAFRRTFDPALKPTEDQALSAKLGVLNDMIVRDLLVAKAKTLSIEATGAEIETAFAERKKNLSEDAFQKQLADRHLTVEDVKEDLRRELTVQKLLEHEVNSKALVTDQEVTEYFNANRPQFNLNETAYRIAQIVITPVRDPQITNRQSDDAMSPQAAAQKLRMITDRLRSGAQFGELAMDYSEDPQSAPQGGDLGLVTASQLRDVPPAFRDAVLKAQPGAISQVNVNGVYTLVLLVSKEPAGQRDLTTPGVRDGIVATLRERHQQLRQLAYLTVVRNEATVVNLLAKQIVDKPAKPATLAPAAPGKQ
jgi:peptidyl-prolyl cis-trans isomerase SurA